MSDSECDERRIEEASEWFARLRADDVSPEDRAAFDRWRRQDSAHRDAYESISRLWERLERPTRELLPTALDSQPAACAGPPARRRPFRFAGLAAVVASLAVTIGLWLPDALTLWSSDYSTVTGEQRQIVLADGSTVLLNTDSALSVQAWGTTRDVTLLKGEAAFSVTSHPDKPFHVKAGPGTIRVIGTKFSIRAGPERVTVTVTEGVVTVQAQHAGEPVQIEAGREVSYGAAGVGPVTAADVVKTLAWQRGQLVFTMESLGTVIEELNRYHSGMIVLANPRLRTRTVSGVFTTDDPMRVVNAVKKTLRVRSLSLADRFVWLY